MICEVCGKVYTDGHYAWTDCGDGDHLLLKRLLAAAYIEINKLRQDRDQARDCVTQYNREYGIITARLQQELEQVVEGRRRESQAARLAMEERNAAIEEARSETAWADEYHELWQEAEFEKQEAIARAEALLNYVQHDRNHRSCRYYPDDEHPVCVCGLLEILEAK